MDDDHSVQPFFEPFTGYLTVYAYDQYDDALFLPVYIDGNYVGNTFSSYGVTSGTHEIYVETPFYWYMSQNDVQYYYYDDDGGTYNYDNPMSLSITSDMEITAYYYRQWWSMRLQ
jgi:hypothetical protein